jgi:hypothetical protein
VDFGGILGSERGAARRWRAVVEGGRGGGRAWRQAGPSDASGGCCGRDRPWVRSPCRGSMAGQAVNPVRGHSLPFPSGWRTRRYEPSAGEQGRNTVVSAVGHAEAARLQRLERRALLTARRGRPCRWRSGCSRTGVTSDPRPRDWMNRSIRPQRIGRSAVRTEVCLTEASKTTAGKNSQYPVDRCSVVADRLSWVWP